MLTFRFTDCFLPRHLAATDFDAVRRARLIVALAWAMALLVLLAAVQLILLAKGAPATSKLISLAASLNFFSIPWVLRRSSSDRLAAAQLVFGSLLAIALAAWNAYGLFSPGLLLLPVFVLVALVVGGSRLSALTSLLSLVIVGGYLALELSADRFPDPPLDFSFAILLTTMLVLGIGIVAALGWFYEGLRQRALGLAASAYEEARAGSEAKSAFLATMSHELRTPLNSIIGFSNMLRKNKRGSFEPRDLDFLERISRNGKHLLHLVDQVLDLSRIEAGHQELKLAPVALSRLVAETLGELESEARSRGLELFFEDAGDLAPLDTDAEKLRQILRNLLANALKFTEEGGVTVRLVAADDQRTASALEVSDTGIGIPPEKLETIFERFEQGDKTTARRFGGSGLGLAISRSLAELLGYRLEVESELGVGSTFRLVLRQARG